MDLEQLKRAMIAVGVRRMYAKVLAANDNSKNQPYFGGDFSVLNILPTGTPQATTSGSHATPIFRAALDFSWMDNAGGIHPAPNAKLILYPQYPEVRFSGYLQGCTAGPTELMGSTRIPGRILILGVTDRGRIIGYAAAPESAIARAISQLHSTEMAGVFVVVPISGAGADRALLLAELRRIAEQGWIASRRLDRSGATLPCNAPNCGGYTLEAELGITPNGISEPDFHGWEVKQHAVSDFVRNSSGPITLMTPEPSAGVYADEGVIEFVDRYGYTDTKGRADRRNFGGGHRFGMVCERTGLTLTLTGYDQRTRKITDALGGVVLIDSDGTHAATWPFSSILDHWKRKHAQAAYVPSQTRDAPAREYRYGQVVRLGTGTDILRFLDGIASGAIFYDPGIKVEGAGINRKAKRRNQFRIRSNDIGRLYGNLETVDVRSAT